MKIISFDKSPLAISLGVAFEHFDMLLFSLLASSIVGNFIANPNKETSLLYAYFGYAIAFLFRPLGAFIFGGIGDLFGRKSALLSSMALMSISTLGIAFTPSFQVLGITATLLFFLCRIGQGLSVGGEYGTAMTYAYEHHPRKRTFFGALIVSSTHLGGVLASMLASLCHHNFRLPFLIGGFTGFALLFCRSLITESVQPKASKVYDITKSAISDKRAILEALLVASMLVLVFYGSFIYLNELVYQKLSVSRASLFRGNTFLLTLWVLLPPVFGYFADKNKLCYKKIMTVGALGVFLSAPFLGLSLSLSCYPALFITQIILHVFHMLFCLCTPQYFGQLFTGPARNTKVSTYYSLGASLMAAVTPLLCQLCINLFHSTFAICMPFMAISLTVLFILTPKIELFTRRAYATR